MEDHEIEDHFPMDYTYTLPLKCIAEIYGSSSDFAALVSSRKYIYIDGHLCCNDEKAELYWITKYQNIEECLNQMPEGVGSNEEEYWRNNYSL